MRLRIPETKPARLMGNSAEISLQHREHGSITWNDSDLSGRHRRDIRLSGELAKVDSIPTQSVRVTTDN